MVSKKANWGEKGAQSSAPTTHIQTHTERYIPQMQIHAQHTHIIRTSHISDIQKHHVKTYTDTQAYISHWTDTHIDTHTDRDTHITHG